MARSAATAIENNFSAGLITEATGLNFPENACTETYNCVFENTGEVYRRPGIDLEGGFSSTPVTTANNAISQFLWENVGGNGNLNMEVVQIGSTLRFYAVGTDAALSGGLKGSTVNLLVFKAPGAADADVNALECQYTYGSGKLFVAHSLLDPFYVSYDSSTDTLSTTRITLQIRDLKGVDDGLEFIDTHPTTLSDLHKYNLYNQGWAANAVGSGGVSFGDGSNRIPSFFTQLGFYPANSDVWWIYKAPNKDAKIVFNPKELFSVVSRGNSPAPKGYYILDAFYQDRSAVSGIDGIPVVTSGTARPSCIAFFAGRVFYAGVQAEGFNSRIYFSQIIENDDQYGKCYQVNDLTSETLFDLLPSDGGVIVRPEIGTILRLVPVDNNLIIVATNGTWVITGNQGIGFTAVDYAIKSLGETNAIGASSFVVVAGSPTWWNHEGIWGLAPGGPQGVQLQSLTDKKIASFYHDIPSESKRYARGEYNPVERTVQWLYRSTEPSSIADRYKYDRVLVLDTLTGAFYPWTIGAGPQVCGITVVQGVGVETDLVAVTDNAGVTVTDNDGLIVTAEEQTNAAVTSQFKYLTINNGGLTWADHSPIYADWESINIQDYESYLISGYKIHGDAERTFQTNYVWVYCRNDVNSSFDFQSRWNFANVSASNRFSPSQRIVVVEDYQDHIFRRLRVRGSGLACQFRFSSVAREPFNLVGWAVFETGNTTP